MMLHSTIRAPKKLLLIFVLTGACLGLSFGPYQQAHALSGSDFNAGDIIDNGVFTNYNAMSEGEIQNFLSAQVPACDTNGSKSISYYYNSSTGRVNNSADTLVTTSRAVYGQRYDSYNNTTIGAAPYVCLQNYVENTTTNQNNLQGASVSGGISAAQIIYNAAHQYQINPEVILATMQKEQGLVTDDWPWTYEYTEAMGYNCSDSAGCNGSSGFYTQVNAAAAQFRNYLNNPNDFNYVVGNNTIEYAPSENGCNRSGTVDILNTATGALYDYTPYQPDSNVLNATNPTGSANGPGSTVSGDSCATYGNRNFWWYFNTWFGGSVGTYSWSTTGYKILTADESQYVDPGNLQPGQWYMVDVAATNTGTATWYNDGYTPVRLGTDDSPGHNSSMCTYAWISCGRPTSVRQSSVPPGQVGNFDFMIEAPYTPGSYRDYFKPLAENYTWMNSSPNESLGITVSNPGTYTWSGTGYKILTADESQYVDPGNLQPGTQYMVDMAIVNKGTATWHNSGPTPVRLGIQHNSVVCDVSWINCQRAATLRQSSVPPGQVGNFDFIIGTPATPGTYREVFTPLAENYTWMNTIPSVSLGIIVK